jgi:hypothetical protein
MSEHHPGQVEDDGGRDQPDDPASSHGSDLDARVGDRPDEPDQPIGDEVGP